MILQPWSGALTDILTPSGGGGSGAQKDGQAFRDCLDDLKGSTQYAFGAKRRVKRYFANFRLGLADGRPAFTDSIGATYLVPENVTTIRRLWTRGKPVVTLAGSWHDTTRWMVCQSADRVELLLPDYGWSWPEDVPRWAGWDWENQGFRSHGLSDLRDVDTVPVTRFEERVRWRKLDRQFPGITHAAISEVGRKLAYHRRGWSL